MELKSGSIARTRYSQIRKKLGWDAESQASNAATSAGAGADDGDSAEMKDGDTGEPVTPVKTPRKPRKPRQKKADGLASPSPSKKRKSEVKAEKMSPEIKKEEATESGDKCVSLPRKVSLLSIAVVLFEPAPS